MPGYLEVVVDTTKAAIVSTADDGVVSTIDTAVSTNPTTVTRPFTERLLRDITCLTAEQQLWLVKALAAGKMDKAQFKTAAEKAKTRNGWRTKAARRLKDLPDEYLERTHERIDKGAFDPHQGHPIPPRHPKGRDPQTAITFVRERVMIEG
jgi:hypothetical protein